VGQGKFAGQRPVFYHCATQPTIFCALTLLVGLHEGHLAFFNLSLKVLFWNKVEEEMRGGWLIQFDMEHGR